MAPRTGYKKFDRRVHVNRSRSYAVDGERLLQATADRILENVEARLKNCTLYVKTPVESGDQPTPKALALALAGEVDLGYTLVELVGRSVDYRLKFTQAWAAIVSQEIGHLRGIRMASEVVETCLLREKRHAHRFTGPTRNAAIEAIFQPRRLSHHQRMAVSESSSDARFAEIMSDLRGQRVDDDEDTYEDDRKEQEDGDNEEDTVFSAHPVQRYSDFVPATPEKVSLEEMDRDIQEVEDEYERVTTGVSE